MITAGNFQNKNFARKSEESIVAENNSINGTIY
jgi:hypothetical protein